MAKPKKQKKTAEEIRQQKRDCERRRRAKIKNNPTLYEAAKEKDRARYAEKKQKKQVKLVNEMTPREHRKQLKEWLKIIVKFLTKRTEKHFLGQVIGFDGVEPNVKFTKKIKDTKDHFIFIWIEPDDIFPVPCEDIMAVLTEPTPGRRRELQFSINDLKQFKNIQ